ncbi:hypothetical protein AU184_15335 [Mycolicibacterium novocastrense]|uniref:GAP family protein n=1 Tax=Mycolicibacterium novocastrense TaxID=59813 RepID=UPI0007485EDC|nr:GAP family protein [Mycolicibacterium novocastrense]KUH75764.1 hypothetical protein AU183_00355 [Mycolicibacterium novocastrense]KUH78325.1 hypothetical protein AU072_10415 [Mycolicibacterium novocastrense]KUH79660.1 hypothetical protein AU184_15335 [Mycolicibacterium novocastrense]
MWSALLGLALVTVPDPLRLVAILLVISRPRPVQNLFAYWLGCLVINGIVLLTPLIVLYYTPALRGFVQELISSAMTGTSTIQPVQVGIGVLLLLVAALLAVRPRLRQRVSAAEKLQSSTDTRPRAAISRTQTGDAEGPAAESAQPIRRLLLRARSAISKAWKGGAPWVSFLMGLSYLPPQATIALAIIAASGAVISTQIAAACAFVLIMLAVVEITLVGYMLAPAKTEAILRSLHDRVQAHRRVILVAVLVLVGSWLAATGLRLI